MDSGAWIALVNSRDRHHAEADTLFRRAIERRRRLVTTNLVVAEVHRLILFRVGIRAARAVLARMEESPSLNVELASPRHHIGALAWLDKLSDYKLTYTDAVSFAVMEALGCREALSFDSDFEVAGFELSRTAG